MHSHLPLRKQFGQTRTVSFTKDRCAGGLRHKELSLNLPEKAFSPLPLLYSQHSLETKPDFVLSQAQPSPSCLAHGGSSDLQTQSCSQLPVVPSDVWVHRRPITTSLLLAQKNVVWNRVLPPVSDLLVALQDLSAEADVQPNEIL